MNRTKDLAKKFLNDDRGSDLIEYALVAAVLALSAVVAEGRLTNSVGNEFNTITNKF
jgi:Flp pilus assembly pilin Flp